MRQSLAIIILLFLSLSIKAQYYSSGADPANTRWRQLNSETFKVVYPEEFEGEAKRFIAMLDSLYEYGSYSLEHTPKPIQVLIHSKTAYSNGFVSWAPKRMEIYPTPHQDMFAQDWLEQLAIHEFRHVVQIDKLNKGFTKFLTIPFGQQAIGAVLGLYAPLWFLEGDAVVTETTLSKAGRGRRPSFEQETKAQVLEKQIYHYDKAYFGSYKDYVPNHYHMGYLYVAGARFKYGADVWERALDESGRKSWSITPFNRGIKSVSGKNKVPLYNEVYDEWRQRWQHFNDSITPDTHRIITARDDRYKNYNYPTPVNNNELIAEINGPGELNHFARINMATGEEEKLLITGTRNREPFSYANNTIVWTELERHPRWENQYFSVVRTLDINTGKQTKINGTGRYKAPALSPDGQTIAITNTSLSNQFSIHLLNAKTGQLIKEIATPANAYPFTPSWDSQGNKLVLILLSKAGKSIETLDPGSEQWTSISSPTYTEIRFPKLHKQHVYFTGSYNGVENLYRVPLAGGKMEKLTESEFGAAYSSIREGQLFYQNYSSDGYLVAMAGIDTIKARAYEAHDLPNEALIKQLQKDEKGLPPLKEVDTLAYSSKKYSKWNLFNFHSWAPAYINIDNTELTPGISAMSQNLLGTTFITAGYNADKQYSREKFNLNLSYRAWWPVFELEFKAGNESIEGAYLNENDWYVNIYDAKPNHYLLDFEMKLPLNLTRGKYIRFIEPSVGLTYQVSDDFKYDRYYLKLGDDGLPIVEDGRYVTDRVETQRADGIDITSMDYSLFAYNLLRTTQRDVSTRWGQVAELKYRNTPFNGWDYGSIFGIHTRLYFPGIGRHHAIRIDNDWHSKQRGDFVPQDGSTYNFYRGFSDYARFPRGVNSVSNDELYSFKADYILPLANPDFNIPGVLYLKRITTNLFFDYSHTTIDLQETETENWITRERDFRSVGTEIRAELHPLRFVFPVTMGYRYAYLHDSREHYHEVLFSLGLAGIVVGK
ncbi:TolB family protein [Carboxylicivirga sp. RSCT41]|uniref:TolB family protein n=1 Tax=Carboxylicivirga agarovorans TaxID=3417570 RepID=UPI003D33CA31